MKRYVKYKDSGVEWIGEIPEGWKIVRIKFLFKEKQSTKNIELNSGAISFGEVIYKKDDLLLEETKLSYQELLEGEFLINPLNLNYDLKSLRIAKSKIDAVVSQGYIILKLVSFDNPEFIRFVFREFDVKHLKSLGNGVRQTISFKHLSNEFLPLPPLKEQEQIVAFLDEKTSNIDNLLDISKRKIGLLKEQRTSIINQVVSKGLNPNAKMKDSGVEWIGEIPEGWGVKKLKYVSEIKISSVDKHIYPFENQVKVCNYTDVYYNEFITNKLEFKVGSCSSDEYSKFKLFYGDVIITKDSETANDIGIPSFVIDEIMDLVCGYHLTIIRTNKDLLLGSFLFRELQTIRIRRYFEINANGITRFGLGKSSVLDTPILLPPLKEQEQIVAYLDEKTSIIDKSISIEERRIGLLKEYRQSLISEVITGKIKVSADE
jgi:type I restriction enzyme, S subunit